MGLETGTYISDLVNTNPVGATDLKSTLDDHIRLLKSTILTTFPNVTGAVTATHTQLNYVDATSSIQTQMDTKAPIADPTFTGEVGIGAVNVSETELGILEGATLTTAELNILDGVTSTAAELNVLDGITPDVTELNYVNGVTSAIQTQLDAKAPVADPTFTGEVGIGAVNVSETELGILEGATLTTAELNYNDVTTLGTAEASKSVTVSASGATTEVANLNAEATGGLRVKVVDIGDWNMDSTANVSVALGVTYGNIRSASVVIRSDSGGNAFNLDTPSSTYEGGYFNLQSNGNINIYRISAGYFDGTSYDSTSYNRGWITIWYTQ